MSTTMPSRRASPLFLPLVLAALGPLATAQEAAPEQQDPLAALDPKVGEVPVGEVAIARLGEGWRWLESSAARRFLMSFGNPDSPGTLGVAIAPDYDESGIFAVYSYADEGHIEDDESPDWDELLDTMKESTAAENEARREAGVVGVELLGWAEPPHYDAASHKMYWAERLRFDGNDGDTLNYNVRVLGRTGHLVVQGVGDIEQLPLVAEQCKELLRVTEFVDGQRYTDFDPAYDKVAAYGIGGLVAGKLALKAGLFAKLGVLFLKFLKPILVGLAVIGGLIWKIVGGRRRAAAEELAEPPTAAS